MLNLRSLKAKLFVLFAVVASFSLLTALVGTVVLREVSNIRVVISEESVPNVVTSLSLSDRVSRMIARVQSLALVESVASLEEQQSSLNEQIDHLVRIIDQLKNSTLEAEKVSSLDANFVLIQSNIQETVTLIQKRLVIETDKRAALETAHGILVDLEKNAAPSAQNAMTQISNTSNLLYELVEDQDVDGALDAMDNLFEIEFTNVRDTSSLLSAINEMEANLGQLNTENSPEKIENLKASMMQSFEFSKSKVTSIPDPTARENLSNALDELNKLVLTDSDLYAARLQEVQIAQDIVALNAKNVDLAGQISQTTEALGQLSREQIKTVLQDADSVSTNGFALFLLISVMAFASSFAIVWIFVVRNIGRRIGELSSSMIELASGNLSVDVPHDGADEIADMARTVQTFKESAIEVARLQEKQTEDYNKTLERAKVLDALTQEFDQEVGVIMNTVTASAEQMRAAAYTMETMVTKTTERTTTASKASDAAAENVNAVVTASDELISSIQHINDRVMHSTNIAKAAVEEATKTNGTVSELAGAALTINEVVNMITDIAGQTNLLALNATIEAARAGDAGKGFSVVASEVKNLASQTTSATEQIGTQIASIQSRTDQAVEAIGQISSTINQVNSIITDISSAVEKQDMAIQDISGSVTNASRETQQVDDSINGVNDIASQTGVAIGEVLQASDSLTEQFTNLKGNVNGFLERVKQV